jgi:hypothetical protein
MKTKSTISLVGTFLCCILFSSSVFGQSDKSKPSPAATANGKVGNANVTVSYSSPAVKGRKIWGELVPYGKVWRAGANEATIFQTDTDLTVEGKKLPAGKYSLFAIPGENEWTIIFNSETGQWGVKQGGVANLDRGKDVLSVNVKPRKSNSMNERLTYEVRNNSLILKWENLEVPVTLK